MAPQTLRRLCYHLYATVGIIAGIDIGTTDNNEAVEKLAFSFLKLA